MKINETWLREWVNPALSSDEVCQLLTFAGLEVEAASEDIIEISITPNRGDCLSVAGLAQDLAAITHTPLTALAEVIVEPVIEDTFPIVIHEPSECAQYAGRIIREVRADAITPLWMQERLQASGLSCINPIVDVMNYVMLELGQPMHAFDLKKIHGSIQVRMAKEGESLQLLDGQTVTLAPHTFIIADEKRPLAIAGVMGGLESGVTSLTHDIFLESAFFQPLSISKTSRYYKLISDSSYRFERGVDPQLQIRALQRATQLLLDIVGGKPGPLIHVAHSSFLPQAKKILLQSERLKKILGLTIPGQTVEKIFLLLGFFSEKTENGWQVIVPARRFDITLEIDLIEEIIRIYGYDQVPQNLAHSVMRMNACSEKKISLSAIRHVLCNAGYQEVITYSFIDEKMQKLFDPTNEAKQLMNPITADMSVMRTTLWPGLVNTYLYNQNRQQSRVRIFESGLCFILKEKNLKQENRIGGLIVGSRLPEQWGEKNTSVDFFDLKGHMEALLDLTHAAEEFEFRKGTHPALHPGQTADLYRLGQYVGVLGIFHPFLAETLGITEKIAVFELALEPLQQANLPHFEEVSRFPEIRRDLAILVHESTPVGKIQDTIKEVAGELFQSVNVFDIYQGKGIPPEQKSVALALTLQHTSRTLVDEEVASLMERIIKRLKQEFTAELRG